jgi:hypothetical protein
MVSRSCQQAACHEARNKETADLSGFFIALDFRGAIERQTVPR